MNNSTKRALKNLGRVKYDKIYYQILDDELTLVTDGSLVVTVYTSEFNELKDICFKHNVLDDSEDILTILRRDTNNHSDSEAKLTSLSITQDNYDRTLRVFKSIDSEGNVRLIPVNKAYMDVISDLMYMPFASCNVSDSEPWSPIYNTVWANDKFYGGYMIFPVATNVKEILERILN